MKKLFPVTIIICAILASGCQQGYKTADECNSDAVSLLGKAEGVMASAEQIRFWINNTPGHRSEKEKLEKKLSAMLDLAAGYLYDANKIEPTWYKITAALARCENARGNPETAVKFALDAIKINPSYHVVYQTLGTSYMILGSQSDKQGDPSKRNSYYHKSIAAYEQFIKMRKDDLRLTTLRINIILMKKAMGED